MSLQSIAQQLFVVEPISELPTHSQESAVPLEVMEMPQITMEPTQEESMEVAEPVDVSIVIEELPGAPEGTKDPEPIEVKEEDIEEAPKDKNDSNSSSKKDIRWDWESRGPTGFIAWVKERCNDVPKHSGYDTAGLERALAYLDKLDNEISKAMRLDLDGHLDADQIEKVRSMIDDGMTRLHNRLDKVKKHKKNSRKKKSYVELPEGLVKEAQKITGVKGIFVTVDLLTSRIARVCINGMVSGGHDIEYIFDDQVKKYNLNIREQAQVMQLLEDMGFPVKRDRGLLIDEEFDQASSDNFDYASNPTSGGNKW